MGSVEYEVIPWARQRGQATLPNLQIGNQACRVLSDPLGKAIMGNAGTFGAN